MSNKLPYPIEHIGIAVEDLDKSIKLYCDSFGATLESREKLIPNGVEVAFINCGNTKIEFLVPLEGETKIRKFLDSRGEGLHHICYEVKDIDSCLQNLKEKGFTPIDDKPRTGAHNSKIAFLKPKEFSGVLVELCELL